MSGPWLFFQVILCNVSLTSSLTKESKWFSKFVNDSLITNPEELYKSKNLPENEIKDLYIKRIHDENEIVNSSKSKADLIINL